MQYLSSVQCQEVCHRAHGPCLPWGCPVSTSVSAGPISSPSCPYQSWLTLHTFCCKSMNGGSWVDQGADRDDSKHPHQVRPQHRRHFTDKAPVTTKTEQTWLSPEGTRMSLMSLQSMLSLQTLIKTPQLHITDLELRLHSKQPPAEESGAQEGLLQPFYPRHTAVNWNISDATGNCKPFPTRAWIRAARQDLPNLCCPQGGIFQHS